MSLRILTTTICLALTQTADCTTLNTVAEALRMPDCVCDTTTRFDFTGTVLTHDKSYWFFRDDTGGIEILNDISSPAAYPLGCNARIRGRMTVERNGTRKFWVEDIRLLKTGCPPTPCDTTVTSIRAGLMDFKTVRLRGVVSSVLQDEVDANYCWANLRTAHGNIYLTLNGKWNDTNTLKRLIDGEVVVTGLACPITGLRRNLGKRISIGENDEITLVSSPATDPFAVPDLSYAISLHRQRARGEVLAATPTWFILRTNAGRVLPVHPTPDQPTPLAGDAVTVSGFATTDPYRTRLSDAFVRIDSNSTCRIVDLPERTLNSLFRDSKGSKKIDSRADCTSFTVRGQATFSGPDSLFVSDGGHSIALDIPTLRMLGIPLPADGSKIFVQGLCLCEFENPATPTIYPTFKRFVLIPRSASDLVVLETPPWWTPYRLMMLVIALGTVLLGSATWNFMLKRKAEKRGRELYDERIDHALAEQKVEERTRLAVELHDSVSQTLTGVALQLDGGEVETAKTMLASCRGELRRCLWDLRSRTFEEKDMTEAVTRTITPHLNDCKATVRFNVPRERLSESLTHAILRIVRELVVNAIRHGQAKHVKIAGEMHENTVSFSVADDGTGFTPDTAPGPNQGHFGLLGIRERIEDFDGSLKIASAPNQGAKFTVTLNTAVESNER